MKTFLTTILILILNIFIVYFGRIYFPANFHPMPDCIHENGVTFFENYLVLCMIEVGIAFVITLMVLLFAILLIFISDFFICIFDTIDIAICVIRDIIYKITYRYKFRKKFGKL